MADKFELEISDKDFKSLVESGVIQPVSEAEWSRFVLRALINYHSRMIMGDEKDPFNKGLRYALALVEKELNK